MFWRTPDEWSDEWLKRPDERSVLRQCGRIMTRASRSRFVLVRFLSICLSHPVCHRTRRMAGTARQTADFGPAPRRRMSFVCSYSVFVYPRRTVRTARRTAGFGPARRVLCTVFVCHRRTGQSDRRTGAFGPRPTGGVRRSVALYVTVQPMNGWSSQTNGA